MVTYNDLFLSDVQGYPEKRNVAFSAGLHGWAFTLTNFAKMYVSKFGVEEGKMMVADAGELDSKDLQEDFMVARFYW